LEDLAFWEVMGVGSDPRENGSENEYRSCAVLLFPFWVFECDDDELLLYDAVWVLAGVGVGAVKKPKGSFWVLLWELLWDGVMKKGSFGGLLWVLWDGVMKKGSEGRREVCAG
jgi:hypothetical protein